MILNRFYCILFLGLIGFGAHTQPTPFKKIAPTYQLQELPIAIPDTRLNIFHATFDDEGYLWLSTNNGLWQFDGQYSQQFLNGSKRYPILKKDMSSNFYELIKDKNGNLITSVWGENVLIKYNPDTRQVLDTISFLKSNLFEQLLYRVDDENRVYFTAINKETMQYSLNKLTENNIVHQLFQIPKVNGIDDKLVQLNIVKESIFLLTETQIYVLNLNGDLLQKIDTATNWAHWPSTFSDDENFYILNEFTALILRWDFELKKLVPHFKIPNPFPNQFSIFAVDDEKVVCFRQDGLFVYNINESTYQEVNKSDVYEINNTNEPLYLIDNGIVIREDGAIYLLEPKKIHRLISKSKSESFFKEKIVGLSEDLSFRGLTQDSKNNIFVTFYPAELAKKEPSAAYFSSLKIPENPSIKWESTYDISAFKDDIIFNNTLLKLENKTITTLKENGPYHHTTQFIKDDSLWFYVWGTNDWEYHNLKTQEKKTYSFDVSFHPQVRFSVMNAIVEDENGENLYVASQYNGISVLSKEGIVIRNYSSEFLQTNNERGIYDLFLEPPFLWYGGFDGLGVLNLTDNSVKVYNLSNNLGKKDLSGREVFFILPLSDQEFYLGTDKGLILFNKNKETYYELPKGHSLVDLEYNRNSYLKATNGKFYVGTTNGLYSFYPEELDWNTKIESEKKVRINLIAVSNNIGEYRYISENVNQKNTLKLAPNEVNVEIHYMALQEEQEILFSHKIEEINTDWSEYSSEPKINLVGLSPGDYKIQIRTANSPNSIKELHIYKAQYWYLHWYSLMSFVFLAMLLLGLLLRYRYKLKLQQELELADLRVKISSDLHDDVGSLLTSVAMQSEILGKKASGSDGQTLKRIEDLSREAMSRMRDTVWSIDSRKDDVQSLIDRMKDLMVSFFQDNENFTYQFKVSNKTNDVQKLNPFIRQQVYLIFKEALTNVIKHSNGDFVEINFNCSKTLLFMEIKDNGSCEKVIKTSGIGIANMQMRAKKLNGEIKIFKENGFHVILNLPLF